MDLRQRGGFLRREAGRVDTGKDMVAKMTKAWSLELKPDCFKF